MEKVKKITGYRLFLPLSCLLIVLLINLITTPTFFKISITMESSTATSSMSSTVPVSWWCWPWA